MGSHVMHTGSSNLSTVIQQVEEIPVNEVVYFLSLVIPFHTRYVGHQNKINFIEIGHVSPEKIRAKV